MIRPSRIGALCVGLTTLAACSDNSGTPGSGAGGAGAGSGGSSSLSSSAGRGGAMGTGGMPSTGGATGVGGSTEMGGMTGAGGEVASGGMVGAGGTMKTGGVMGVGGVMGAGGVTGTGGMMGMGGMMAGTGGRMGTGGMMMGMGGMMMGMGGRMGTGGMMGMGGSTVHADAAVACHAPGTFSVTNSGMTSYTIDMMSNPTLTLCRGSTYMFSMNATGHPFYIKTSATTGTTPAYDMGVTNNGADSGTITFAVPASAPSTLFYHCSLHTQMGGTIDIVN